MVLIRRPGGSTICSKLSIEIAVLVIGAYTVLFITGSALVGKYVKTNHPEGIVAYPTIFNILWTSIQHSYQDWHF